MNLPLTGQDNSLRLCILGETHCLRRTQHRCHINLPFSAELGFFSIQTSTHQVFLLQLQRTMNSNQRAPPSRSSTQAAAQPLETSQSHSALDQRAHAHSSSMVPFPATTASNPADQWASSHESVAASYGGLSAFPADAAFGTPKPLWMLSQLDELEGEIPNIPLPSLRNLLRAMGATGVYDGIARDDVNVIILGWYERVRVIRARRDKDAMQKQPSFARHLLQQPTVQATADTDEALERVAGRRKDSTKDVVPSALPSPEKPPHPGNTVKSQIDQLNKRLQDLKFDRQTHIVEHAKAQNDAEILADALMESRREIQDLIAREKSLFRCLRDRDVLDKEVEAERLKALDKKLAEARLHAKQDQDQVLEEANESHRKEVDLKNNAIRDRDEIHQACLRRIEELGGSIVRG